MVSEGTNGTQDETGGVESRDTPVTFDTSGEIRDAGSDDAIPTVEPATIIIEAEPEGRRRGGRPRGSKNRVNRPQSAKEVSQDLTGILLSVHFMLAKLTKIDELELDEEEAKKLGEAVARVNREFGVQIMSPKTAALLNLAVVGGAVYGPRAIAIMHNGTKKATGAGAGQGRVVDAPTAQVIM